MLLSWPSPSQGCRARRDERKTGRSNRSSVEVNHAVGRAPGKLGPMCPRSGAPGTGAPGKDDSTRYGIPSHRPHIRTPSSTDTSAKIYLQRKPFPKHQASQASVTAADSGSPAAAALRIPAGGAHITPREPQERVVLTAGGTSLGSACSGGLYERDIKTASSSGPPDVPLP